MADAFNEKVVLLLQGGGALGSYQGGIYETLERAGYPPTWIAGISIGAVNGAIIAGNPPERRIERLHEFWMRITESVTPFPLWEHWIEGAFNQAGAVSTMMFGAPGFFSPRIVPPMGATECAASALSFYDTSALKSTLETLVDFDRINSNSNDRVRLSVGAVDIESGNFAFFDSNKRDNPAFFPIRPEHIMASGALPPGLPPVEIGGRNYWDGGLVSNTPLQYVIDEDGPDMLLAFQVDLFSQKGPMPHNLLEAAPASIRT
jgi:NTE family protein